jgi:hypothetical protein
MHSGLRTALPILIVAAVSCGRVSEAQHPAGAGEAFSYADRIGWFHGPCLAISNPKLTSGTPVGLVVTGAPQRIERTRIVAQTDSSEICKALLPGRMKQNTKSGATFYSLDAGTLAATDMGIGIVSPPADLAVAEGLAGADLAKDGKKKVFSSCATSEAIKFNVWSEKAYRGEPLWSSYYRLDYDVTPTCP